MEQRKMMQVRFKMDGVADDRVFKNVVSVETGEYEHGNEAMVEQYYRGEVERFPVRGYAEIEAAEQIRPEQEAGV